MISNFNGYMITFHCSHCGKNFPVVWESNNIMPKYLTCPYCKFPYSASKQYEAKESEVIIV